MDVRNVFQNGGKITKTYFCPFHEDAVKKYRKSKYRKPSPGMILKACRNLILIQKNLLLLEIKYLTLKQG